MSGMLRLDIQQSYVIQVKLIRKSYHQETRVGKFDRDYLTYLTYMT
jgi:hypothetical protein